MTTTIMRDSIVGDAWINASCQAVPIQRVIDPKTGQPTGDLLTGPVRLSFCDTLFTLPQPSPNNQNPKHGSILLFPPVVDFSLLYEDYNRICGEKFRDQYDAASGQFYGLHSPFRNQAEKAKFGGFTPGCLFITSTSKFKPPIVDIRGNPIIDPAKVYAGVWAICGINAYSYNDPRKKGVAFGLQSVMVIGDDTKLAGGAPDTNAMFAGARGAIAPPAISGGIVGGMPPAGGTYAAQPPFGGAPQGGFQPQQGGFAPPGAPQQGGFAPSQFAPPPAPTDDWSFMQ